MIPGPGEIILLGLIVLLLIAGKYCYNKIQAGRRIYKRKKWEREHDQEIED